LPGRSIPRGRFRTDLFFRISTFRLVVPPLRDRGEDVILLFRHFLAHDGGTGSSDVREIAGEVGDILLSYRWPGNVRELQNAADHVLMFADRDSVVPKDLPDYLWSSVEYADATDGKSTRGMERGEIGGLRRGDSRSTGSLPRSRSRWYCAGQGSSGGSVLHPSVPGETQMQTSSSATIPRAAILPTVSPEVSAPGNRSRTRRPRNSCGPCSTVARTW
jgi:hypothetical protein